MDSPYAIQKTIYENKLKQIHGIRKSLEQQIEYFSIFLCNMKSLHEKNKDLAKALEIEDEPQVDLQKIEEYLCGWKKKLAVVVKVLKEVQDPGSLMELGTQVNCLLICIFLLNNTTLVT